VNKPLKTDRFFFLNQPQFNFRFARHDDVLPETVANGESVVAGCADEADAIQTADINSWTDRLTIELMLLN